MVWFSDKIFINTMKSIIAENGKNYVPLVWTQNYNCYSSAVVAFTPRRHICTTWRCSSGVYSAVWWVSYGCRVLTSASRSGGAQKSAQLNSDGSVSRKRKQSVALTRPLACGVGDAASGGWLTAGSVSARAAVRQWMSSSDKPTCWPVSTQLQTWCWSTISSSRSFWRSSCSTFSSRRLLSAFRRR